MSVKLTLEILKELGLSDEKAKAVLEKQNETKPRIVIWRFKATEARALEVVAAFPDLVIERPNWKK